MLGRLLGDLRRGLAARKSEQRLDAAARPAGALDASTQAAPTKPSNKKVASYRPGVFDVNDIDSAKRIILTGEAGTTTEARWQCETPYLVEEIGRALELNEKSCVLDYGCGVGRIARALIERYRCFVVGVDISASMRALALEYVNSERFAVCAPEMLDQTVLHGFRVTHAYACWVIQHCALPDQDLARIDSALADRARLFILSTDHRCVPTDAGWVDDGISIEELLTKRFDAISKEGLPAAVSTPEVARCSYLMTLCKKPRPG